MKRVLSIILFFSLCTFAGHGQSVNQNGPKTHLNTSTQKVKVFPNPATNVVNILGLKNSNKADILVTDVYGNVMLNHHWKIKNNALNIPIVTLDTGIYMVTIRSQEQYIQAKFYKK
ncbi:MAG: T9SS type A sorting domain-containing protein [Maribacter sp.]